MDSSFDPHAIEQDLYREWEGAGHFEPRGNAQPYCIAIPPPNITGSLHMGHAFQHTLMDALIRYQRMQGRRTLWQMGTDHAGIATQMLVERQLLAEGTNRHEIGREAFEQRVWQWRNESGDNISQQLRRMGSSLDWSRDRFTLDDGFSRAVRKVFIDLYDQGLIYRGNRLVNWDPSLQTAISDLEVENSDEQGSLWHFRYPLNDGALTRDGKPYLTVATTRPETMLGDTAVAVHPDDDRFARLVGGTVRLPLAERNIPIIADDYVDPEFGSGCVKITPAHDFNDYEVGKRHNLPMPNIFNANATLNDSVPEAYRGLDRQDARKRVVEDLDALDLLDHVDPHQLSVPRGDRSGAIIEPLLTDQWFVKIEPLARPAIAAVENGDIEFVPKQYENLYFAWMRNIQDWCISRQQWWGHRIPAFYDADGNVFVGWDEADVRTKYDLAADTPLRQEDDVLETWFSSSLWTFATLGWPDDTPELRQYHPTDALVTGHDIIFFWVARMIMMTLHFMGEVPFRTVYIHGLVRDAEGQKMSKTKGNGLDPLDLIDGIALDDLVDKRTSNLTQPKMAPRIEKRTRTEYPDGIPSYGTDALRFTFCALASTGRDVRFDLNRTEGYRNFCNKLWNAARFVLANTEDFHYDPAAKRSPNVADHWIMSRASNLLERCERAFDTYRFDLLASELYEFIWHEYCDWYLEITKPLLWDDAASATERSGTQHTLLHILEVLLRALHPVTPFITETVWRDVAPRLGMAGDTIMLQAYPASADLEHDSEATEAIEWLKAVVLGIRAIRGEANISPGTAIPLLLQGGHASDHTRLERTGSVLQRLAKIETIDWLDSATEAPPHALHLVDDLKVMVPLAGLIDVEKERERLTKKRKKVGGDLERVRSKLDNPNFVQKAPGEVIAKEREKAEAMQRSLTTLDTQLAQLDALG